MLDHAQYSRPSKESVGQLFVRNLTRDAHPIEAATILTPTRDAYARVTFSTARAMDKRESFYSKGLHCIGPWHTHPEPSPVPPPMAVRSHANMLLPRARIWQASYS